MQTSLARRQRHRRSIDRGRPSGSSTVRRVAIAIPIVLFVAFLGIGVAGAIGIAAAYNYYSQGLPDPRDTLSNLSFDQQTIVTDRNGVLLASLGDFKRELVTFDDIPPEMIDATTAIEDKDFWSNPGFDVAGFVSATVDTLSGHPRGGSTITQQLVRARLLPESAFAGTREERKIREIIQSLRLTQAYPGIEGKQEIITAYLNQNFYGNQSYGIKAAARTYFGKNLKDLTLAQEAILAAIPQSPTAYDLVKNADAVCTVKIKAGADCPNGKSQLVVPDTSEIVIRRNYVLDQMKTRSPLSGSKHSVDEYEQAKLEPVVLAPQGGVSWKAAQFVWQVRSQLADILCPDVSADQCTDIDTGGYRVTTTLDWKMQTTTEKWLYAAARVPNLTGNVAAKLKALKIPSKDWSWIQKLRSANINNGAAAVMDYRTGQVLAYAGSASYTANGSRKFQPKFDVLSDGWRQPGSSIKPINYSIGIEDRTMTAATMFMDVTTDFGGKFEPTQADKLERGPVRLRSALEFSLNIPSIKAGIMNGLDHFYHRAEDFGIHWIPKSVPVVSMSIGTIEVHPIDMISAYGAIANGGKLVPRTMILKVTKADGTVVWPDPAVKKPKTTTVISPQTAYIMTDILAGNTQPSVNPFWGEWAIYDHGVRRPAAYKTGTTSDNRDVHAYGFVAPPKDPTAPAIVVGVWMGNSDNSPDTDTLSLGSSAPLWSRILTDVTHGTPIVSFKRPSGIVEESIDAFSGMKPGPFTTKTVNELFIPGTEPKQSDDLRRIVNIDSATGLLWQDGCSGPERTISALDFSQVEADHANWQKADNGWVRRAASGAGVGGGLKGSRTSYFYGGFPAFFPFGRSWGGSFAPTRLCPIAPVQTPPPCDNLLGLFCPTPEPSGGPGPSPSHGPKP